MLYLNYIDTRKVCSLNICSNNSQLLQIRGLVTTLPVALTLPVGFHPAAVSTEQWAAAVGLQQTCGQWEHMTCVSVGWPSEKLICN